MLERVEKRLSEHVGRNLKSKLSRHRKTIAGAELTFTQGRPLAQG
jgi:hypothetical protein